MLVIGTGAVASFLVPRLRAGGGFVQLFGSSSPRLRALSSEPGDVAFTASRVAEHGAWLVVCKTYQNGERVQQLALAPRPGRVLVLQNGFEPEADWAACAEAVERGLLTYGLASVGPGRSVGGERGEVLLGRGSPWAPVLRSAGLKVREVEDIRSAVWWKLIVNASLNVVAALGGWPNGEVLEQPSACRQAERVALEVAGLARRVGVAIGDEEAVAALESVARATSSNVCSTLADLRGGRPTEYDAINGALLRLAHGLGFETPALLEIDQQFRLHLDSLPSQQAAS